MTEPSDPRPASDPVFFLAASVLTAGRRGDLTAGAADRAHPADAAETATPDVLRLEGPEGKHAADVRRLRVGEQLVVTDGAGTAARCRVVSVRRAALDLEVVERWTEPVAAPRIVVVQALAKGDRGETAVETLTEVGVDVIVPWAAKRSVTRWSPERLDKALDRWRSTAKAAAKQSRRVRWPEVTHPASTAEVEELLANASAGLVLDGAARETVGDVDPPSSGDVVLVVGPEGGITPEELAGFERSRAKTVRLGPSTLRTSTAGTVAAAVLLARTPRWRTIRSE